MRFASLDGLRCIAIAAVAWRHVGVVSYGIYLLHGPIVGVARRLLDSPSLAFVIGFAASIAVASISHRFFERPFLDLRERFRPTRDAVDRPLSRLSSNAESC